VFADGLNIPSGIAVGHGGVWVANAPDLLYLRDTDGDLKADTREVVVTGFGRLGAWFASRDVFGIEPDLICCAKGLSSGYQPIGAVLFSQGLWDDMAGADRWFTNGFTYAGHPVACAAALKNIEIMEREGLCAHAREMGAVFQARLAGLADLPLVGDVRGIGLIGCVENVADKASKALLSDEVNVGKRISDAAERHGLMVRPMGHLNVMSPPLVISEEQIDFTVSTLGTAIREVADGLVRDGVRLG